MELRNHGPRERLAGEGTGTMSDQDLLTLILSPGTSQVPGDALAAKVLSQDRKSVV